VCVCVCVCVSVSVCVSSGSHEDVQAVLCSMYIFIINGITDLSLYLSPDSVGIFQ
jgi:hypothetical protein